MAWIKLHNKFISWEWFAKPEMVQLFVWLLLKAASRDTTWQGIAIKRGQVLISQRKLAAELVLSYKQVRTCLQRLQTTGEVTAAGAPGAHGFTLVTICNYDSYQATSESEGRIKGAFNGALNGALRAHLTTSPTIDCRETNSAKGALNGAQKGDNIKNKEDNIVVVADARTREGAIEKLRQELRTSTLKAEAAMRATRIYDSGSLQRIVEEVFAEWTATDEPATGVNWAHLLNQLRIKAEAQRREAAKMASIPKPQQSVKEWRQKLAADVMKGVALNQAFNNNKKNS